ncbi:MAG TPA: hypothetical protein VFY93_00940 [Planctomycetota bacterium]|nr:hypothetical protein [Planctomycetota bacterium]
MTETKRVPTELETRALLRTVASRMKDDEVIGEYASASARVRASRVVFPVVFFAGLTLAPFLDRSVPFAAWAALTALLALVADQAVTIARLTRATGALARTAQRARPAEPLPRAPFPSPQRGNRPAGGEPA